MTTRALAITLILSLAACSGEQGPAGADGRITVLRTADEAPGANCASGGLRVDSGVDDDGDGALDDAERDATAYVCRGADGTSVAAAPEDPGASCPAGGVRVTSGGGAPVLVCNGETGATGAAGESVVVTAEPAGPNCELGGQRVQVGSGAPAYVCDGATGAAGESVAVTPEPDGPNCPWGGQRLQVGAGAPTYVCDGAPGETGAAGESVAMTPEPAGPNCPWGGQRLQVGAGAPTYVCDGAPGETGPAGESVSVTPEPDGPNCAWGGARLQVGAGTATYVCDGAPGETGAPGESVSLTPEPAGPNCTYGGQRLQVGTGDPTYVCDGAPGETGVAGESVTMTPEPPGTHCAFGGVRLQVGTGPVSYLCSGAPPDVTLPTVRTALVTDVRYVAAVVEGTVPDDGGELVLLRGVVLAAHPTPTVRDAVYLSGNGAGAFSTLCDGLDPATTYFVRAFATNVLGTAYGEERSFTTRPLGPPALSTRDASNVTSATAILGGDVGDDGGSPLLARGACWSLAPDPTLADACAHEGPGGGSFLALATGLAPATTYHVRAYAANAQGTAYGDDRIFTTAQDPLATVTTDPASVGQTTATVGGSVVSDNGTPVTSRGVCWGTAPGPTTAGAKWVEAAGVGSFAAQLSGLQASTAYHARAFAVSAAGTSYGNEVSFTTLAPALPTLTTKAVTGISSYLAGSGGTIATDGGSPITAKGVCWSVNPSPTTANAATSDGTGAASWNSTLTGLTPLTTYYVRAYATNALGTAYGNQLTFTTTATVGPGPTVPVVGSSPVSMTAGGTATGGGYVSNEGGSPVTARGLCWGPDANPTIADTCSTDGGTGPGFFSASATGLGGCGVVYHVRAYATNATGTGYGGDVTVSTGLVPTLATADASDVGYFTATSGGTVLDAGGCAIAERGVVWSLFPNPTVAGSRTTEGPGETPFLSSLTGLYANRTYYTRAYATNSAGTGYGPQVVFATLEPSTPYLGQSLGGGIVFHVDETGLHGLVVAPSDQSNGRFGCYGTSVPTQTGVGSGATNTASIVASCQDTFFAAKTADNLVLNGYGDWFLPSLDELLLVWTNLASKGIGGFTSDWYSTSSEADAANGYRVHLGGGYAYGYSKTSSMRVRAVRAF